MSDPSTTIRSVPARRIQVTRRRPKRATWPDTTVTDSWPPRLNTSL